MKIPGTLLAVSLLLSAACTTPHSHPLLAQESAPFVFGAISHRGETDFLVLETSDERYEGEFRFERVQDWRALQKRYRSDPKRWNAIMSGLDRSHIYNQAIAKLRASNGNVLMCQLLWRHVDRPSGTCSDAHGSSFNVAFDKPLLEDPR